MLLGVLVAQGLCAPGDVQAQMHGDHNPHHGGIVLMYGGDLHYEVVLSADGKVQLWLSDAMRTDLPAAMVSDVAVEIERSGKRVAVDMQINDSGECWQGKAGALKEDGSVLHLAFVFREEAAVVEFPVAALMGAGREQLIKDSAHGPVEGRASGK